MISEIPKSGCMPMHRDRMSRSAGQVLLESLTALAVTAVAFPLLAAGLVQAGYAQQKAACYYTAMTLMERKRVACRTGGRCAGEGDFGPFFEHFHYRIYKEEHQFEAAGMTLPVFYMEVFWRMPGQSGKIQTVLLGEERHE